MSGNKLQRMQAAVSRFISKASKKNEPLEAFRETEAFKQFQDKLSAGIGKQIKWVQKNLDQIDFLQDDTLSDSQFEAKLQNWLQTNMPAITEYVAETKVYAYLFNAFLWSVQSQYARYGVVAKSKTAGDLRKDSGFVFELTNPHYIAALKDQANYLLHKSSMDNTTRNRMITFIRNSRLDMTDINQLAEDIADEFEGINDTRAFLIANTETNNAMSTAQEAFLKENQVKTKVWIPAGSNTCPICNGNADDGEIGVDDDFSSGDSRPPAHPGCECYLDGGEIDLDSIDLWDGS